MFLIRWLRALLFLIIFPIYTVVCSILVLTTNILLNDRRIDNVIIRAWARGTCLLAGVSVKVQGLENVPAGGCVFLFNHTSFFDIFAIYSILPELRFGAKVELFKIPFFGYAMRRVGILPIDRSKREKVYRHYEKSRARIEAGEKFVLAPEGTRQEAEVLAPFKAGPFVFAISSKAPVVPLVIRGAAPVWPKKTFFVNMGKWHSEIQLNILSSVSTDGESLETRHHLQQKVYDMMNPYFKTTQSV